MKIFYTTHRSVDGVAVSAHFGRSRITQYPSGSIISAGPADETSKEQSCRRMLMDRLVDELGAVQGLVREVEMQWQSVKAVACVMMTRS